MGVEGPLSARAVFGKGRVLFLSKLGFFLCFLNRMSTDSSFLAIKIWTVC